MSPAALSPEPLARLSTSPTLPRSNLKRKRSGTEGEGAAAALQSDKRRKVAFDPDVEVRRVDELGGKSVLLISEEIKHAIRQHERGVTEEYEQIKSLFGQDRFSDDGLSTEELRKYLLGLINNATLLNKSCHDLVHTVLDTHWLAFDDALTALYTRFLGNLVSSQPGYLARVLMKLVENFAHVSTSAGALSRQPQHERRNLLVKVHTALKYVLQLVPVASRELSSALSSAFPHPTDSTRAHVEYVRNLLALTAYAPALKADVLALIVDRLIKIDVQVQTDVEDLEEEAEELLVQGELVKDISATQNLFEDGDESDTESVSSDDSVDEDVQRIKALKSAVQKMDSIMDLLFAYYTPIFVKGSARESQSMFDQLLSLFRKTILPTGRSRHTQFLIFHFAQTSPMLTSRFIDVCMQILQDKTVRSSFTRLSAAAYIGSFVARGKHVSTADVRYVFHYLGNLLEQLRRTHEPTCILPDMHKYSAYYGVAQALIYIFCFRWKDLLVDRDDFEADEEEDDEELLESGDLVFLPGVKETLSYNMMSKLNPLKVCAPEIVNEYARVAHSLRFLYVYSIIEQNRRVRLSQVRQNTAAGSSRETALSALHGERHYQLDAYFPFDPYNLPFSKRWIVGDYNEWKGVPGENGAHGAIDQDNSSQGDVAEADVDDEGTETPVEDD